MQRKKYKHMKKGEKEREELQRNSHSCVALFVLRSTPTKLPIYFATTVVFLSWRQTGKWSDFVVLLVWFVALLVDSYVHLFEDVFLLLYFVRNGASFFLTWIFSDQFLFRFFI